MTQAKEGDLAAFLSRELEAADRDPLRVSLDEEFFPLRGRVRQLDWRTVAKVAIPELDEIGIEPTIEFNGGESWAGMLVQRHIKQGDNFDTSKTFTVEPVDEPREGRRTPKEFRLSLTFTAKGEKDEDVTRAEEAMKRTFRVRVMNYLTGQTYYAHTSYEVVAGMYGSMWFLVDEFDEVDGSGNNIATHNELNFPNDERTTQNLGITFESVDKTTQKAA